MLNSINTIFKQAVITIDSIKGGNAPVSITYDINKNGFLDYYTENNTEYKIVDDYFRNHYGIDSAKLAVCQVNKILASYRLDSTMTQIIPKKTIVLKLEDTYGLRKNTKYYFGRANGKYETVEIVRVTPIINEIDLKVPLQKKHAITGIERAELFEIDQLGGFQPMKIYVTTMVTSNGGNLHSIVAHELLHSKLFGVLVDVNEFDNVMFYSTTLDGKVLNDNIQLRYREQTVHYSYDVGKPGLWQWSDINREPIK